VTSVPPGVHELTVGQLSARSGVAVSALRFYEAQGLITAGRTAGNQRRYPRDALRRVAFIRASQRVGIPLRVIKQALDELPGNRAPTRQEWGRASPSSSHCGTVSPAASDAAVSLWTGATWPTRATCWVKTAPERANS
jgi:DNA-binding transcriptional MerR regulator